MTLFAQGHLRKVRRKGCGWTCQKKTDASLRDYTTGIACPPEGFPYVPNVEDTQAGLRALDPYTDGCSVPRGLRQAFSDRINSGENFDFRNACATHDYAYDLLRYWNEIEEPPPFHARDADLQLEADSRADCDARNDWDRGLCNGRVSWYWDGVTFRTSTLGDPIGDIDTSYQPIPP